MHLGSGVDAIDNYYYDYEYYLPINACKTSTSEKRVGWCTTTQTYDKTKLNKRVRRFGVIDFRAANAPAKDTFGRKNRWSLWARRRRVRSSNINDDHVNDACVWIVWVYDKLFVTCPIPAAPVCDCWICTSSIAAPTYLSTTWEFAVGCGTSPDVRLTIGCSWTGKPVTDTPITWFGPTIDAQGRLPRCSCPAAV